MFGFEGIIFAVLASAVSTAITYFANDAKADKLEDLARERKSIEDSLAISRATENQRKRNVKTRAGIALANSMRATRNIDTESGRAKIGNQAFLSSLKGAEAFATETAGLSARIRANEFETSSVRGESAMGLASTLAAGSLNIFASYAAANPDKFSSPEETPYKTTDWANTPGPGYPSGDGLP